MTETDPQPTGPADSTGPEENYPGYALPPGSYRAPEIKRPRYGRLLGVWGAGIVAGIAVLVGVSIRVAEKPTHYMCPPDCGRPVTGIPVMALPRYTSPTGKFSVSYPTPDSAYEVTKDDNGVTAKFTAGDTGVLQLFSQPAHGRTAKEIGKDLIKHKFPDAKTAYEIPNATVGYQAGYGEVADSWPPGGSGSYIRIRTVLLVAVKNDLALIVGAVGPYHAFGPDFGPGLPSGVNLQIAQDMGKYVNSFSWQGDPAR